MVHPIFHLFGILIIVVDDVLIVFVFDRDNTSEVDELEIPVFVKDDIRKLDIVMTPIILFQVAEDFN